MFPVLGVEITHPSYLSSGRPTVRRVLSPWNHNDHRGRPWVPRVADRVGSATVLILVPDPLFARSSRSRVTDRRGPSRPFLRRRPVEGREVGRPRHFPQAGGAERRPRVVSNSVCWVQGVDGSRGNGWTLTSLGTSFSGFLPSFTMRSRLNPRGTDLPTRLDCSFFLPLL